MPTIKPEQVAGIKRKMRRNALLWMAFGSIYVAGRIWLREAFGSRSFTLATLVGFLLLVTSVAVVVLMCWYLRRARLLTAGVEVIADVIDVGKPNRHGMSEIAIAYEYQGERYQMVHEDRATIVPSDRRLAILVDPNRPYNFAVVSDLLDQ